MRFALDDESALKLSKKLQAVKGLEVREAQKITVLLRHIVRYMRFSNPCFMVSLTLFSLLPKPVKIHFAVENLESTITAHAWTEWNSDAFSTHRDFEKYHIVRTVEK